MIERNQIKRKRMNLWWIPGSIRDIYEVPFNRPKDIRIRIFAIAVALRLKRLDPNLVRQNRMTLIVVTRTGWHSWLNWPTQQPVREHLDPNSYQFIPYNHMFVCIPKDSVVIILYLKNYDRKFENSKDICSFDLCSVLYWTIRWNPCD